MRLYEVINYVNAVHLTTKSDRNSMRPKAIRPCTGLADSHGQRRYRTRRSYLTTAGSDSGWATHGPDATMINGYPRSTTVRQICVA